MVGDTGLERSSGGNSKGRESDQGGATDRRNDCAYLGGVHGVFVLITTNDFTRIDVEWWVESQKDGAMSGFRERLELIHVVSTAVENKC